MKHIIEIQLNLNSNHRKSAKPLEAAGYTIWKLLDGAPHTLSLLLLFEFYQQKGLNQTLVMRLMPEERMWETFKYPHGTMSSPQKTLHQLCLQTAHNNLLSFSDKQPLAIMTILTVLYRKAMVI